MKTHVRTFFALCTLFVLHSFTAQVSAAQEEIQSTQNTVSVQYPKHENDDKVRAFPGAEGGGMYATGGRGGRVIKVTNLNDSGEGSLRAAINAKGARTIVFEVDGVIELESILKIRHGDVTIAGQTAPGDGICIKNYPFMVAADNVIIRFIRCRMGDEKGVEDDAMGGRFQKDIIVDHCSISWCTDEAASFYANANFTMQWCLISESLRNSVHAKGSHGYGAIWGGVNASYHHNLLAHNDSRNPRFDGGESYDTERNPLKGEDRSVDYRNCVVYNFGTYPCYGGEGQSINFVGNYYKWGPASVNGADEESKGKKRNYFYYISGVKQNVDYGCPAVYTGKNTNFLAVSGGGDDNGVNVNNWKGFIYDKKLANIGMTLMEQLDNPVRINPEGQSAYVTTHKVHQAYKKVLDYAGACHKRDAVDERAVKDTRSGKASIRSGGHGSMNGYIDTPSAAGGWPTYAKGEVKADTDGDGIPDWWEDAMGLDKENASDSVEKLLDTTGRYTNLEVYLHWLVQDIVIAQAEGGNYTEL